MRCLRNLWTSPESWSSCRSIPSMSCTPMVSLRAAFQMPLSLSTKYHSLSSKCFSSMPPGTCTKGSPHYTFLALVRSFIYINQYVCFFAKPKSAMIALPSFMNMLASLRSLCKNLLSPISTNPLTISFRTFNVSDYVILRFFLTNSLRSPWLQNSVIMKQCEGYRTTSKHLRMLQWFKVVNASISQSSIYRLMESLTPFMSMALMATVSSEVRRKCTGEVIGAFVNNAGEALANLVRMRVREVFDFFTWLGVGRTVGSGRFFVVVGEIRSHPCIRKLILTIYLIDNFIFSNFPQFLNFYFNFFTFIYHCLFI